MKRTVKVSDDLNRRAKAEAALRARRRPRLAGLMKGARGAVDSGYPDLASNHERLAGFGSDARRNH